MLEYRLNGLQSSKDYVSKNNPTITTISSDKRAFKIIYFHLLCIWRIANFYIFMTIYRYLLCVSKLSRYASKNNNLTLQNIEKNVFPTRLNASCKKNQNTAIDKNCPKIISFNFVELFPLSIHTFMTFVLYQRRHWSNMSKNWRVIVRKLKISSLYIFIHEIVNLQLLITSMSTN